MSKKFIRVFVDVEQNEELTKALQQKMMEAIVGTSREEANKLILEEIDRKIQAAKLPSTIESLVQKSINNILQNYILSSQITTLLEAKLIEVMKSNVIKKAMQSAIIEYIEKNCEELALKTFNNVIKNNDIRLTKIK